MSTTYRQDQQPEDGLWRALQANSDRITEMEVLMQERTATMRETIASAVRDSMPQALLTDRQHRWVEMAIEREAQTLAFRRAIIEKTTGALVWAIIAGLALLIWVPMREFIQLHFWNKP